MTVIEYAHSYVSDQSYGGQLSGQDGAHHRDGVSYGELRRELADAQAELSSLDRFASPARVARAQAREKAARRALHAIA